MNKKNWIIIGCVVIAVIVIGIVLYSYSGSLIQSENEYKDNYNQNDELTPPVNQKPVGYISIFSGYDNFGDAPLTTKFEWIGSDPDGFISSYRWNFGDGYASNEITPIHTFTSAGTYHVSVTVTDNDGGTDNETTIILVYEPYIQEPPEPVTEISLNPTDDSYIELNEPDLNHGNDMYLIVTYYSDKYYQDEDISFLKFDISQIESNVNIKSAILKMYVDYISTPGNISVYRCTDNSWSEDTITWNNAPSYSSNSEDSQYINSDKKIVEWNVTNYLKESVSTYRQITFVFRVDGNEGRLDFDSKDYSRYQYPILYIDWE